MSSLATTTPKVPAPTPTELARGISYTVGNGEIRIPASAWTFAGFRAWSRSDDFPERGRIDFINQEIFVDMSAEELNKHGQPKFEITRVVGNLVVKHDRGMFFPDRTRVVHTEAGLSNEPDAAFASWESLDSGRVRLVPHDQETDSYLELEGTPDWAVEIVSASSVHKDTVQLRAAYHRAGIPEYWLVDARGEQIDFQILWHGPQEYVSAPRRGASQESRVFGRLVRLLRKRNRMGYWEYQLKLKRIP
jgi:Uma2 family endonuclease